MESNVIKGKWHVEYQRPRAKKTRTEAIEDPVEAILTIARLLELKVKLMRVRFERYGE